MSAPKLGYSIDEAAQLSGVSSDTIRKAIHSSEGTALRAKKVGRKYLITHDQLTAWLSALPDA